MPVAIWTGTTDGYWDTTTNWTPNGLPAAGTDVVITGAVDLIGKASGAEDTAIVNACGHFTVMNYSGQIGNPGAPLTFDDVDGFEDDARVTFAGTGKIYISLGEGTTTGTASAPFVSIIQSATASNGDDYGIYLDALNIQKLTITGGSVAVGSMPGDAVTIPDILIQNGSQSPRVLIGQGVTPTTVTVEGGDTTIDAAATLSILDISSGSVRKIGSNTVTSLRVRGDGFYVHNSGTITDFDLYDVGELDTTQSDTARTITNGTIYGGVYKRHHNAITHTNEVVLAAGSTVSVT